MGMDGPLGRYNVSPILAFFTRLGFGEYTAGFLFAGFQVLLCCLLWWFL